MSFRLALIDSEQDKEYLRSKLKEGKTSPLGPVPPLTEGHIDRATHIVGMMGAEPWQKALELGRMWCLADAAAIRPSSPRCL